MIRWNHLAERGSGGLRGPVLTLLAGSGAAFLIGYAAKLVLLRLYDPAAFGLYEFVVAVVSVLIPISSLRYEDAIVLPERDEEARDVLGVALLVGAGIVILSTVLLPLAPLVGAWAGDPDVAGWLWMVPLLLLVIRVSKLGELWLTRRQRFGRISTASVTQSAVMTATRIAAGLRAGGVGGLLGGFAVGHAAAAVVNVSAATRDVRRVPGRPTWAGLAEAARRYRRFGQFSAPAALVAALATRVPFLLLLVYFDRNVLGLFGQAFNVLYVPLALLAAAVGQVFFVRAAESVHRGELPALAESVHGRLVLIALFPVAAVAAAGPDVFEILFGASWRDAGTYATLISGWVLFTSVASPLTRLFDVLERQRADLVVNLVMFAVIATCLVLGGRSGSATVTVLALGVAGALVRLGQIIVALRLAGVGFRALLRPYRVHGLPALAAAVGLLLVRTAHSPGLTTLAFFIALGTFALLTARREGLLPWALRT